MERSEQGQLSISSVLPTEDETEDETEDTEVGAKEPETIPDEKSPRDEVANDPVLAAFASTAELMPASALQSTRQAAHASTASKDDRARWSAEQLAGRFVELSGTEGAPLLTVAMEAVHRFQRAGEPVAWIARQREHFYPPDAARAGIDLAALVVACLPTLREIAHATERLLRSGAFGLIVLDAGTNARLSPALQSRLAKLGQTHDTTVLLLGTKPDEASSVGPLVSLRACARRAGLSNRRHRCAVRSLKDRRATPGWEDAIEAHGPPGLR